MLFLQTGSESKVHWGKSANHPDQSSQSTFSNRPLRGLISCIHLNSDVQHVANFTFLKKTLESECTQTRNVNGRAMNADSEETPKIHTYIQALLLVEIFSSTLRY